MPPFARGSRNEVEHVIKLHPDAFRGEPDDANVLFSQPGGPSPVMCDPLGMIMALSIDFDGETHFCAVEVQNVGPDGMLPSEFQAAKLSPPQADPKPRLGW